MCLTVNFIPGTLGTAEPTVTNQTTREKTTLGMGIVDTLGTAESSVANMSTRGMNNLLVYANHSMHIIAMSIFNVHVCMLNINFLSVDKIGISQPIVATRSTRSKGILSIKQMFLIMPNTCI